MKKARGEGALSVQEYDEIEEKLKRSTKSQNTNLDKSACSICFTSPLKIPGALLPNPIVSIPIHS
jgi:hypothetical protein